MWKESTNLLSSEEAIVKKRTIICRFVNKLVNIYIPLKMFCYILSNLQHQLKKGFNYEFSLASLRNTQTCRESSSP